MGGNSLDCLCCWRYWSWKWIEQRVSVLSNKIILHLQPAYEQMHNTMSSPSSGLQIGDSCSTTAECQDNAPTNTYSTCGGSSTCECYFGYVDDGSGICISESQISSSLPILSSVHVDLEPSTNPLIVRDHFLRGHELCNRSMLEELVAINSKLTVCYKDEVWLKQVYSTGYNNTD